jgi:hypothetical protein
MLNQGAFFHGSINDNLVCDSLASTPAFIRCDDNTTFTILDTIAERFGREPCKDDRMDGTNTCTSKKSRYRLPSHWEVDRDGVALLNTKRFENIGDAGDFS